MYTVFDLDLRWQPHNLLTAKVIMHIYCFSVDNFEPAMSRKLFKLKLIPRRLQQTPLAIYTSAPRTV